MVCKQSCTDSQTMVAVPNYLVVLADSLERSEKIS